MHRYILALIFTASFAAGLVAIGCSRDSVRTAPVSGAAVVRDGFIEGIDRFDTSVARLQSAAAALPGDTAVARRAFLDARLAYKRIELLAEQYMPATARAINGPPVVEVAEDDANRREVQPEGLQTIEPLLFAARPDRDSVLAEVRSLAASVRTLRAYAAAIELSDANIFDAMRREVVRVMALGISGYDAPVALSSIPEAAASLRSIRDIYAVYRPGLEGRSLPLARAIDTLLAASIADLENGGDFAAFDRLEFIRRRANPLFGRLLAAGRALGIGPVNERRALRADAATIFDGESFNPHAYSPRYGDGPDRDRVELGRMLFFDPVLSGNGRRACASCHRPELAFTDGRARSIAFNFEGRVARNSPTLVNAALQSGAFYDRRVEFLEDQAMEVLNNPVEMHASLDAMLGSLKASDEYRRRFAAAFASSPSAAVNAANIRIAIASFVRSLVRLDSPFDRYARGASATLDAGARRGFNLFMGKARCGTCHFMPLFNGTVPPAFSETESESIGVPSRYDTSGAELDPDLGRYTVHHIERDRFMFKTPTLRNIALTAPYMHNGAFATLDEVLDFYNRGGGVGIGIHIPGQTLSADRLGLTPSEMKDIIGFLNALTDTTGLAARPAHLPAIAGAAGRVVGGEY